MQDLPFGDEQFDLVVSRNVTWNLKSPCEAYQEWFRVLKPGGSLINFDANWYLHLFDDEYWQGFSC
ncbi:methyltransferase [Proteus mirabilis]|uniref:Methyltransferase n=1 Tax=Proteus mirabilis TaxID=584 RepID=A0A2X2E2V7_PROMI|nr:methyltransferase [Proteus mirabilis]